MSKSLYFLFGFLFAFFSLGHQVYANEADLFEKVFGNKEAKASISLPIHLRNRPIGECRFEVKGTKIFKVDGRCLRDSLFPFFETSFVQNISVEFVELEKVMDIGFQYNKEKVLVALEIPAKFYKLKSTDLYYGPDTTGKKIYYPSQWSHILNYWLQYNYEERDERGRSNNDYELDLDSYLKFENFVLENKFELTDDIRKESLTRKRSRLIYDVKDSNLRASFGDISSEALSRQSRMNLLGVSLSKNYALSPYNRITPLNEFEFVLERRSFITIFINDKPVRSEIYEEGRHSIRDLILDYGRSRVKIVAKEVGGDTREFTYDWSGAEELLRVGLSRYSFNLGVRGNYNLRPKYDDIEDTIFSGYYSQGISKTYTQSFSLQLSDSSVLVGPSFIKSFSLGNLRTYLNFSHDDINNHGGVSLFNEFEFFFLNNSRSIRNLVSHEYLSPLYTSFDTRASKNDYEHLFRYDINWFLNDYINTGIDVERSLSYKNSDFDRRSYGITFGLRPYKSSNVTFNYRRKEVDEKWETELTLFFNMSFADSGHYVSHFYDNENKSNLSQVSYSPYDKQDSLSYSASYDTDDSSKNTDLQIGYLSRYFTSDISAQLSEGSSDQYSARLRGAFVVAENFAAFTPQVGDSFSFIEGKNSLKNKKIGLLNQVGGVLSKEFRNKIFMPSLTSYHYYKVNMDPTHLDFGSSYDYEEFFIAPTYRSVTPVKLGKEKSYVVRGSFTNEDLKLKVGRLVSVSGRSFPFFTNKTGEFIVSDVREGRYEIWLDEKVYRSDILIKSENVIIDIGDQNAL